MAQRVRLAGIAHIAGTPELLITQLRRARYEAALSQYNIPVSLLLDHISASAERPPQHIVVSGELTTHESFEVHQFVELERNP
jgi:hypothetical protein